MFLLLKYGATVSEGLLDGREVVSAPAVPGIFLVVGWHSRLGDLQFGSRRAGFELQLDYTEHVRWPRLLPPGH